MIASMRCASCSLRDLGFCGALLGKPSQQPPTQHNYKGQDHRKFSPNENVVARHDVSEFVYVLCEGWAFRFLQPSNDRRQILRFLLPGDLFSALTVFEEKLYFSVQALTGVLISRFKRAEVLARLAVNPAILNAARSICVVEANDADELSTCLGTRSAEQRIAYLLFHLTNRMVARRLVRDHRYRFPLRQQHIAEAVGLSTVHVSRVMSIFRKRRLVELSEGVLEILEPAELQRIGAI
jgi:CRP/FNR family transcriptional regulator